MLVPFSATAAIAAALLAAPAPVAAAAPPWTDEVRCAALVERMPEMMDFTVRIADALALADASKKDVAAKLKQTVQEARPAMDGATETMREAAKEAVHAAHPAWKAAATTPDARGLTADALFDRELAAARQAYSDLRFEVVDEQTQANAKRFQVELERHCKTS